MHSSCIIFAATVLVSLAQISVAQQTFQSTGENYHAKVTIRRDKESSNSLPSYSHPRPPPSHPWRQGDRITKEEVIQNLAKALLTRKMTAQEKRSEESANNARKLEEYTLQKARQAKMQRAMQNSLQNSPPMPEQGSAPAYFQGRGPPRLKHGNFPRHSQMNNRPVAPFQDVYNPLTQEYMPGRKKRFKRRFR